MAVAGSSPEEVGSPEVVALPVAGIPAAVGPRVVGSPAAVGLQVVVRPRQGRGTGWRPVVAARLELRERPPEEAVAEQRRAQAVGRRRDPWPGPVRRATGPRRARAVAAERIPDRVTSVAACQSLQRDPNRTPFMGHAALKVFRELAPPRLVGSKLRSLMVLGDATLRAAAFVDASHELSIERCGEALDRDLVDHGLHGRRQRCAILGDAMHLQRKSAALLGAGRFALTSWHRENDEGQRSPTDLAFSSAARARPWAAHNRIPRPARMETDPANLGRAS